MISLAKAELLRILAKMIAAAGSLDALTVHLFANDIVPGLDTALSDFTEADVVGFPGYAPIGPVVWDAPFIDVTGTANVLGVSIQFNCTGPASETIYGYYCTRVIAVGPPAVLQYVYSERFPHSIAITGSMSSVPLWPRFTFGQ